jgi:hypothetical protein
MLTAGPPMLPYSYNSNYQIVVTRDAFIVHVEMIHDARIIHMDGRPHLPPAIRRWMGDSIGRWDGDALVVETTNLKAGTRGSSPGLRLTERFTRTGRDAIQYQVTFTDPATWTAPWTAALDMKKRPDDAGVFEYACHEGNHGMSNMLSAARTLERQLEQKSR